MSPPPLRALVQLTKPAVEDLERLKRRNPQVLKHVFARLIALETDPLAGQPLGGDLHGYRKLVVGNRSWRIIWRVFTHEGRPIIDVVEVWAVGARADNEVYDEMRSRLAAAPTSAATTALAQAVEILARREWGLEPQKPDLATRDILPDWLIQRLTTQAGLSRDSVVELSLQQAVDAWAAWVSHPR